MDWAKILLAPILLYNKNKIENTISEGLDAWRSLSIIMILGQKTNCIVEKYRLILSVAVEKNSTNGIEIITAIEIHNQTRPSKSNNVLLFEQI